jgi:hypothetical protein
VSVYADFVDVQADELKPPQPLFLVDWEQGPLPVVDRVDYPDYTFNPQRQQREGTPDLDAYPANPVIAWRNWTYRDNSQSRKPPNVGATNITPRAELQQQLGLQLAPIQYPNYTAPTPADWDAGINVLPTQQAANAAAAQQQELLRLIAGYNPNVVQ